MEGAPKLPRAYQPRTVTELLERRAMELPNGLAVVGLIGGDELSTVTFAELRDARRRLAATLAAVHGVRPGTRVAWLIDNRRGLSALILYHAITALGGVNVPLNPRFAAPEVSWILDHARIDAVVSAPESRRLAEDALGTQRREVRAVALDELEIDSESGDRPRAELHPSVEDDVVSILYTSGTTGVPKGVRHSHHTSLAAGIGWADAFRLTPADTYHSPFPVFSGAGLHFSAMAALWAGATNVVDLTDVPKTLERIELLRSTVYAAVPSLFHYWLDDPSLSARDLTCLRVLDYGGAAMSAAVIRELSRRLPGVGLMQTYGLTEAGPGGLYLPEEYALEKLGSIGNRGAGVFTSFRLVSEAGEDVAPNEPGELLLRGPSVMLGYESDPVATSEAFVDGWLRTGDVAYIDDQGFVFYVDRIKDVIVRGGYNVSSAEVEAALMEHPAVLEAAAVGRAHEALGEEVMAVVVFRSGKEVSEVALIQHCRDRLADFKVPRGILSVDELPRNAAGKVLKRQLRETFDAARGGDPHWKRPVI